MERLLQSKDTPTSQHIKPSVYDPYFLRKQCRWIRDDLDPQVARDGPDILHADDILSLDELLRRLMTANLGVQDISFSRMHLAIISISGRATRWPDKLIDRADELKSIWEKEYGPLQAFGTPLYEPGGRLHGICKPEDVSKERLMAKWLRTAGVVLSPLLARKFGSRGFTPGDWWINPLFALKDGIIDSADKAGGIVSDSDGAYAVLMTHDEEVNCPSPEAFTYRARPHDSGRYRLTMAKRESRQPIRILRSHSLRSFWAPKAGVRYDGLHIITGWSIKLDPKTKEVVYEVKFKRLSTEVSMKEVLRRPFTDEIEDYKEYKRLRCIVLTKQAEALTIRVPTKPALVVSHGPYDGSEDATDAYISSDESDDGDGERSTAAAVKYMTRATDSFMTTATEHGDKSLLEY